MAKVIVAKTAGFCMGVKRAVDMTLELIKKTDGPVYTYGPLIHNPQVIELLAKKGVIVIDKDTIPKGGTIVVRTHGITPGMRKKLEESGIRLYDATCPFVKNVQRIIEEYSRQGYTIIIVGDKGHAEVDSYLGYADGKGMVVDKYVQGLALHMGKICVVAQTTQDKKRFNEIVDGLKKRGAKPVVFDTICNATSKRQEEALSLSRKVDAMIVVGGRNSANTLRLAEICRSTGTPTYFIERAEEIDIKELQKYNTIGITAGASTSRETIQEVVDKIRKRCQRKRCQAPFLQAPFLNNGTPFQQKVWKEILKIPYGKTKTYKEIAKAVGRPRAYRAVGQACRKNPMPIIIPCHRVVRSDDTIGGYRGGVRRKMLLLRMEKSRNF